MAAGLGCPSVAQEYDGEKVVTPVVLASRSPSPPLQVPAMQMVRPESLSRASRQGAASHLSGVQGDESLGRHHTLDGATRMTAVALLLAGAVMGIVGLLVLVELGERQTRLSFLP